MQIMKSVDDDSKKRADGQLKLEETAFLVYGISGEVRWSERRGEKIVLIWKVNMNSRFLLPQLWITFMTSNNNESEGLK